MFPRALLLQVKAWPELAQTGKQPSHLLLFL